MVIECDICVIGGGPAGSVLAARLAQFGLDVVLVEREDFPRPRLGESLSPGVMPLLETIGASAAINAAGFSRVSKVTVDWDRKDERVDPEARGRVVDRGRFDQRLLDHARHLGVRILQPASVIGRQPAESGWTITVMAGARKIGVRARFLADATGRSGIAGSRRRTGARTVALYAYWTGKYLPAHPRIEAGSNGWFWGVPLPDGSYNTLVFLNPGDLGNMKGTLKEKFHSLLATSSLIPADAQAKLAGPVKACDATPYLDEACVAETFIRVGDAALALDPLSSSGVQKAIQCALAGSVVVNTLLQRPQSGSLARSYYLRSLSEASSRHQAWAREYYRLAAATRSAAFWQDRAAGAPIPNAENESPAPERLAPDTRWTLSPDVTIREVAGVVDRFIQATPAVCSPSLPSPVAFLGGIELAPLLCRVRNGATSQELMRSWASELPPSKATAIAQWLVSRRLLIALHDRPLTMARSMR